MTTDIVTLRRGTAAQWAQINPILAPGEPGFEVDTRLVKFGDGKTKWTSLGYTIVDTRVFVSKTTVIVGNTAPSTPVHGTVYFLAEAGSFAATPPPPSGLVYTGTVSVTGSGALVANAAPSFAGSPTVSSTGTLTATGHP
jgi:hypothetical protein